MSDVPSLFGILAVVVGLLYIGSPLAILLTFQFRCPARILFFDPSTLELPGAVRAYFDPAREALTALGFEPVAYFCLPDLVNNAKSISVLFSNIQAREVGIINCIYADTLGVATLKEKHVEFVTRFRDGACVQTNNGRQIGAFVPEPKERTIQYRDLQDIAELYRRHQRICEHLSTAPRRFRLAEEFQSDVEQYLQTAVIREPIEHQVSLGLFRPASDGYRPTIKGAFRLVWQELWPWKIIRRLQRGRDAQKWLSLIGT